MDAVVFVNDAVKIDPDKNLVIKLVLIGLLSNWSNRSNQLDFIFKVQSFGEKKQLDFYSVSTQIRTLIFITDNICQMHQA